ncbi:hypothetical protein [Clavibacter michiganensis]|uniref:hypothetical protein n=1 Tax=Clavibacter michiganensis TaxID=28447 RepID=UPI003EBC0C63
MSGIGASARDGAVVELDGGSVRVHGHLGLMAVPGGVRPIRLPEARWRDFPPAGELLRAQVSTAAGVRIRFTTAADEVRLRVRCTRIHFDDLPGPRNTFVAEVGGADLPPVASLPWTSCAGSRRRATPRRRPRWAMARRPWSCSPGSGAARRP